MPVTAVVPLPTETADGLMAVFRVSVGEDLALLAAMHHQEVDDNLLAVLAESGFPNQFGINLTRLRAQEAVSFMQQAMDAMTMPLDAVQRDELAADYASIYLNHGLSASPTESFWLDEENLVLQAPMFQVREFYRRHGRGVADWRKRSDDHLVHELHFIAELIRAAQPDALEEAARFLDEHLLRWLPRFAERVAKRCVTPFYAGASWLTAEYCEELRDLLALLLGKPRPGAEEIEKRMQPKVQAPTVAPLTYVPGIAPTW
ncbi:MAG: hypothetical protein B7Y41_14475 [Hydrogenophilales bacterium 28-61-23]|nr:MAG: hypothetical protein B7Y41_14475 [Hydrogenophilales bacterium 28-61-23]